jgi:hypothetical protein
MFDKLVWIRFLDLASVVGNRYREKTRPVEIDIDIQQASVVVVNCCGMRLGDIDVAQVLAHHRAILGLHQSFWGITLK